MAIYCHTKPLLAMPKVSPIVKTSKNERTPESIRDSGSNKELADRIGSPSPRQWMWPFVGLSRGGETSKSFVLSYIIFVGNVYQKLTWMSVSPFWAVKWVGSGSSSRFCFETLTGTRQRRELPERTMIAPVLCRILKKNGLKSRQYNFVLNKPLVLLSACAYISTGRKPVLSSEVCLIAYCT